MTEDNPFFVVDGEEYCDEEKAVAIMLREGLLFLGSDYSVFFENPEGKVTTVWVNCSDTFAYATADAEPLPLAEVSNLFRMSRVRYGTIRWLCLRRSQRPLRELIERMKAANAWTDDLEAIPA